MLQTAIQEIILASWLYSLQYFLVPGPHALLTNQHCGTTVYGLMFTEAINLYSRI